jgi:DNA repair photolyase
VGRRTEFEPYRPRTILNKGKRPDHWFWTRYSAYPYLGCQHGCSFCYCRERKYTPYESAEDFAYHIKPKQNAAELLRRALQRQPIDLVFTGDYQPAERKYLLSRAMLEVCCDLGFPVFVLERSPLVLRDLDVLQSIQARAPSVVAFSVIAAPGSRAEASVRAFERLAPPARRRFKAMERIAREGILTGACAMPLLPGICDDPENLEAIVRSTAEHGGRFVLAGSLTLADTQRGYFLRDLEHLQPHLIDGYQTLYPPGAYWPPEQKVRALAREVRRLCEQYGIADRVPRPIIPGDKRARNRRLAEALANRAYALELENAPGSQVWAQRRAAWAIEDLPQDVGLVYQSLGLHGLQSVPGVSPGVAQQIEAWLGESARRHA